ncbi:hypothetical protein QO002_004858 [Pararhizobium capsulatum DSM 1112]|uniref:Uncharacterized protein n=1 Tax=Pararhizobium capsulatum DSM 1112 TaxID=1121113 RepID=A0ABU0BXJ2_9HYPH|nr:hypothetical protein [Pararhizobium capsulatum]MDQ0322652.1 hypothetical protein [Pararhizobium capsulatum DSM 1112]
MSKATQLVATVFASFALALLAATQGAAQEEFSGRPGLTGPEGTPAEIATCDNLRQVVKGFKPVPYERVDLWISGPLTILHTDRVLWYLAVCSEPGIRVMCVTYSDNGMKLGERVVLAGAMNIQDPKHIVLDPCLASREDE